MANNIYVGGFPYKTTKEDLAKLFSACGTVVSAKIILDRETGRPKGFGFVEMSTDAEAKAAVAKLNGTFLGDRKIFVVEGRVDRNRPEPGAAKPAATVKFGSGPGLVDRRSGKDRRAAGSAPAAAAAAPAPAHKKPWDKTPWEKKPKPWEKKPKPWEKKGFAPPPYDPSAKENHKPWAKKPPFERKPPVRGPKWTPKKP